MKHGLITKALTLTHNVKSTNKNGSGDPIYLSPGVTHRSQKVKRSKQEPPALERSVFLINSEQTAYEAKTLPRSHGNNA